jgi:transcriptional regulator with XRE-family HTH domain
MKPWYNFCVETTIHVVGQRIRELRLEQELTLEQAAERAGCTSGFLSQVERNQAVPSISMLYAIAHALGAQVADFLPRTTLGPKVVRAAERQTLRFQGSFLAYSFLSSELPDRKLELMVVEVDPLDKGKPADEFRSHPGEEFAHVLQGTLRLWIGDAVYDLAPGDSAHFNAMARHRVENPGESPTTYLAVLTPPLF